MKRVFVIGCFLALFAGELAAMVPPVTLARTAALFTAGRFLEAVEAGRHLGTPEALALAARASACRATHLVTASARLEGFRDTARLARAALSRDPANREARLQLVIALGYLARAETAIDAHLAGYADKARRHLEVAIERGSVTPWTWAVLGAWHAEIISPRRAGPWPLPLRGERKERGREFRTRRSRGANEPDHPLRIRPRAHATGPRGKCRPRPQAT